MTPQDVIGFWVDEVGEQHWYQGSVALDDKIRDRFLDAWQRASELTAEWSDSPDGELASILLTDQFPRNMFRDDSRSFATDMLARKLAQSAIDAGHDMELDPLLRQFVYVPFMHSEELGDQNHCVALFKERLPEAESNLRHAKMHRDVIQTFGRFPWRNEALGRETRPNERAFLDAGGYGAMVQGKLSLDGAR